MKLKRPEILIPVFYGAP